MGAKIRKKLKQVPTTLGRDILLKKEPRHNPNFESGTDSCPVWRFGKLDFDGPFGWHELTKADLLEEILPKIKNFESMTWEEILRRGSHEVKLGKLDSSAQKRLTQLRMEDIEQLVSFRLKGEIRLWGIRDQRICHILWWDPNHRVCPSHLKHT